MPEEHLRHWLAMHAPSSEIIKLWDTVERTYIEDFSGNPSTTSLLGFNVTEFPLRYLWADQMIEASKLDLSELAKMLLTKNQKRYLDLCVENLAKKAQT